MKPRFRITYCLTSPFHEKRRQPLERVGTGYSGSLWLFSIPHAMIGFEKSDFSLTLKQGFWQCLAVGLSPSKPQATRVLKEKCPQEFSGDSSNGDGAGQGHGIQLHITMCFPKRWSSVSTDTKQAYHGLEKRTDDYGHIKFIIVCYCFISFY